MSNPLSPDPNQNLLPSTSFSALNWSPSQETNPVVVLPSDLLIGHINQNLNIPAVTPNPSDSLLLVQIEGSIATIDPNIITLPNDNSFDGLTGEAMDIVKEQLTQFAKVPNFVEKMNLAFGESWDNQAANVLTQDWLNGDFSLIPPVKVVSSAEIGGANGAFAAATDTIYLSRELLTGANSADVADVLLEEIGHSIDSRLNVTDTPGDEGAVFAAVVQGKELSKDEIHGLRGEDDSGTATINGNIFSVEYATTDQINEYYSKNWAIRAYNANINSRTWEPVLWSGNDVLGFGSNTRSDGRKGIAKDWGYTSPANGVNQDNFYLQFWTQGDFQQGGTYNFNVKADDDYALFAFPVGANNKNQVEPIGEYWKGDAFGGKTIQFTPKNSGKYWVVAYYLEKLNDAYFDLSWEAQSPTALDNTITVENQTFPVELSLYDKDGKKGIANRSNIDPNKDTVVVIHGRNFDGKEDGNIINLAETAAASNYYPNSQVLYLDWKQAANDGSQPPYNAAKRIRPVADWATKKLKELGIDPGKTILLGHSLGSYVASEIGRIGGKVKDLVALDPALPGGTGKGSYDIDGNNPGDKIDDRPIDFSSAATKSIALVVSDADTVGGVAGDNEKATSANDSYIVNFMGYEEHGSNPKDKAFNKGADYHNGVVNVFSNIMSRDFAFPSLLDFNRFDNSGKVQPSYYVFERAHEGVISADLGNGNASITGLDYVSNGSNQRTWT
ncbi:hypothetical protein [Planktothrix pseudagardhii]|uniref:Pancreatic lipase-related protein 2 n=1 Tax=Planktothrix pseudagardhii TaxID=132604 RepID=A0A9W4G8J8_9CYAN|nr:hypothetical protein [Planktothrix pseudagardhii]CAD5961250.1 Pancreatic lipase-related protein 2 [Planktothrix pseudagardhii]